VLRNAKLISKIPNLCHYSVKTLQIISSICFQHVVAAIQGKVPTVWLQIVEQMQLIQQIVTQTQVNTSNFDYIC
jgi:hypothetical protein